MKKVLDPPLLRFLECEIRIYIDDLIIPREPTTLAGLLHEEY